MQEPLINISKKQAYLFAGFLVMYEFLTYVANDMIMPGMIQVVHTFKGPESAVATSLTAYILGGASLQIFFFKVWGFVLLGSLAMQPYKKFILKWMLFA